MMSGIGSSESGYQSIKQLETKGKLMNTVKQCMTQGYHLNSANYIGVKRC